MVLRSVQTRLTALLLSLVLGVVAFGLPARAAPGYAGGFSHVVVDTSAIEARGLDSTARFLKRAMTDQMQKQFAGQLGVKGAPALVVRLKSLSMPSYVGPGGDFGGRFGGAGANDFLDGETLIVARDGALLGTYPILANLSPTYAGAWYDPAIDKKRMVALTGAFAGWSRRYVGR